MGESLDTVFGPSKHLRTLRRGQLLFRRGDPAEAVFVVISGRLRLERSLADGTPVTLALLRPGDSVAEAALFTDVYHCDARAEVASRVRAHPKADVLAFLGRDAEGPLRWARHLAGEVRRLRALLELRAVKRADDRVLAYLDLLETMDETWGEERPASAVSAELGLTPEALYRALGRLERAAKIVRRGRAVARRRPSGSSRATPSPDNRRKP